MVIANIPGREVWIGKIVNYDRWEYWQKLTRPKISTKQPPIFCGKWWYHVMDTGTRGSPISSPHS